MSVSYSNTDFTEEHVSNGTAKAKHIKFTAFYSTCYRIQSVSCLLVTLSESGAFTIVNCDGKQRRGNKRGTKKVIERQKEAGEHEFFKIRQCMNDYNTAEEVDGEDEAQSSKDEQGKRTA